MAIKVVTHSWDWIGIKNFKDTLTFFFSCSNDEQKHFIEFLEENFLDNVRYGSDKNRKFYINIKKNNDSYKILKSINDNLKDELKKYIENELKRCAAYEEAAEEGIEELINDWEKILQAIK